MERMIKACSVDKVADCRVLAVLADHDLCATPNHGRSEESKRAKRR